MSCAEEDAVDPAGGLDAATQVIDSAVAAADGGAPADAALRSFSIEFGRSACFGICPVYSVRVDQTGAVEFFGLQCVARVGAHRMQLPPARARAIYDAFAEVWTLQDRYWPGDSGCSMSNTDAPTLAWDITAEQRRKTVSHYAGCTGSEELTRLRALSERVDELTGVASWVGTAANTCGQSPVRLPPYASYRIAHGQFAALLTLSDKPYSNALSPHPAYFVTPNPAEPSPLHWALTDCADKLLAFGRIARHPEGHLLVSEDKRPFTLPGAIDIGAILLSTPDGASFNARALLPDSELDFAVTLAEGC